MMACIDLEARFPGYKIGYDDPQFAATQDVWHKTIVCRSGHICPSGGTKLWACTNGNRRKATRSIRDGALPCVVKMDAKDGVNAEFDISDWEVMFKAMGAKRR